MDIISHEVTMDKRYVQLITGQIECNIIISLNATLYYNRGT